MAPRANGYGVCLFFGFVLVFGSLVMPTLLVAVITASVKESHYEIDEALELEQRVANVKAQYKASLNDQDFVEFDLLFRFGDGDGNGGLTLDEVMAVLSQVQQRLAPSSECELWPRTWYCALCVL